MKEKELTTVKTQQTQKQKEMTDNKKQLDETQKAKAES